MSTIDRLSGRTPRVFVTAAEPSGDRVAASLVRALRARHPACRVDAFAGASVAEAGGNVLHDTVARAAMGWRALGRAGEVGRRLREAEASYARATSEGRPYGLAVCVDSWLMNRSFAALARRHGAKVLYVSAPQAWASRPGRAKTLAHVTDAVACFWPFEPAWFASYGVNGTFVGYPLFDDLPPRAERERVVRRADRFPATPPVIGLFPGSRAGVAKANGGRLMEVANRVRAFFSDVTFLVPVTQTTEPILRRLTPSGLQIERVVDDFDAVAARCDAAVCVSGTATVHAAAWGVPMAVIYAGSPLLWHGFGRWVLRTRTFGAINLVAGGSPDPPASSRVAPEFIPWHGDVGPVARVIVDWLCRPERLSAAREATWRAIEPIDRPGAAEQTASLAVSLLES